MIAHKIGRTLKISGYSPNGHAYIFLTSMEAEQSSIKFAVASVLGISAHGIINESQPTKNLQEAKKWAVNFAKKQLGDKIKFKTATLKKGLK